MASCCSVIGREAECGVVGLDGQNLAAVANDVAYEVVEGDLETDDHTDLGGSHR